MSQTTPLITTEYPHPSNIPWTKKINSISELYIVITRVMLIATYIIILIISSGTIKLCTNRLQIYNLLCAMTSISDIYLAVYFPRVLSTYDPTVRRARMLTQMIASFSIMVILQIYGQITAFSSNSVVACRYGTSLI